MSVKERKKQGGRESRGKAVEVCFSALWAEGAGVQGTALQRAQDRAAMRPTALVASEVSVLLSFSETTSAT